jgi:carbohydrate kinase (thermoresistant glucokinase family)
MIYIVMGVTGCGKTTIGCRLAKHLGLPFFDADDFHPEANVNKMRHGIALDDEDRKPWLEILSAAMKEWEKEGGAVLACSALKEMYRMQLTFSKEKVQWIFLEGTMELIWERLVARKNHYMPPALLESQFKALEKPEYGIHVNISLSPDGILEEIYKKLQL